MMILADHAVFTKNSSLFFGMPKFFIFRAIKEHKPTLMSFDCPSARGRRGLEAYRLFRNNIVPVAVLNDLVACGDDDFAFADSDIGRVKLVE